jgi:hypothetical protein
LFVWSQWVQDLSAHLTPGSNLYLLMELVLVATLVVPASTLFYWRRRHALKGPHYRERWRKMRMLSLGFLVALVFTGPVASRLGIVTNGLWISPVYLVGLYALGADWLRELRARGRAPGGVDLVAVEVHQDPSDAIAAAKLYALEQPDRPVTITGLRYRSLTYFAGTFAPLTLLGTPDTKTREVFSGGRHYEDAELAAEFD